MASRYQFIPNSIMTQSRNKDAADAWATTQRTQLAGQWAAQKRRELAQEMGQSVGQAEMPQARQDYGQQALLEHELGTTTSQPVTPQSERDRAVADFRRSMGQAPIGTEVTTPNTVTPYTNSSKGDLGNYQEGGAGLANIPEVPGAGPEQLDWAVSVPQQLVYNTVSGLQQGKSIPDALGYAGERTFYAGPNLERNEPTTMAQLLGDKDPNSISWQDVVGFGGDLLLDPLNLIGVGEASKAAKGLSKVPEAIKAAEAAKTIAEKVPEAASKAGYALSGGDAARVAGIVPDWVSKSISSGDEVAKAATSGEELAVDIAKKGGGAVTPPSEATNWLPSVKPTEEILNSAYTNDWTRRLIDKFDNPVTRSVAQAIGIPKKDTFTKGLVLRESILADWKSGLVGTTSRLRQLGDSTSLFKVDKDGFTTIGGKRAAINDVLEYPDRYALTPQQRQYASTIQQIYENQARSLAAEGIDIKLLGFDEGGKYVGRRVVGKVADDGSIELANVGGKARVGSKAAFEKGRDFATQEEALAAGYRYLTPEESLQANLEGAGRRIADQRLSDYVLERIPYRTASAPDELIAARDFAKDKLAALGQMQAAISRAGRGERIPVQTIQAIGKYWPDQAKQLVAAGVVKKRVPLADDAATITAKTNLNRARASVNMQDQLRQRALAAGDEGAAIRAQAGMVEAQDQVIRFEKMLAKATERQAPKVASYEQATTAASQAMDSLKASLPVVKKDAQIAYYKTQNAVSKALEKARQSRYSEGTVMSPAFQGKFFSEEDAARLRRMLDMEQQSPIRGAARTVSWLNAAPRMLLTIFDAGPALIQGQLTMFSHPQVWARSVGRSLQALVSEKGYQSFLADHADTIRRWSQDGAIFVPSEFTTAVQQGGALTKVPVLGTAAKPFARSYESLLNAMKIYGLEGFEHLAKTPADRKGLAQFWNEMVGTIDTARMGISPTQREIETALLFAPRYRRATLALMSDVAKGGLRGKMARDALGKTIVAGLVGYVGIAKLLGQEPHLDPREGAKFLTINVAGQDIGMGGAFYSTSRAMLQMALDPGNSAEIAAKYVTNSLSPVVGTVAGAFSYPYQYDSPLKLTKRVIGENLTPIWLQSVLLDDNGTWAGAAAEFLGARAVNSSGISFESGGSQTTTGNRNFTYPGRGGAVPMQSTPTNGDRFKYPGRSATTPSPANTPSTTPSRFAYPGR